MGVLTEATMRLRKEMMAWRHMRVALRNDLVRQTDERRTRVSALCGGFARDRAGAHRAWFGPTLFESQTAERQQRRGLVEAARAKVQAEESHLPHRKRSRAVTSLPSLSRPRSRQRPRQRQRPLRLLHPCRGPRDCF
jgi:hypothetical protein